MSTWRGGVCLFVALTAGGAQTPASQPPAEVTTRESSVTFKTKVNMVSIPVVARDSKGHAVGNLSREDFQVYDNGKLQTISRFSVEKFGETEESAPVVATPGAPAKEMPPKAPTLPERYVVYLFDDVNTPFSDLAQAREAAYQHMLKSLRPTERAAIYTTSGEGGVDFTLDREKLHKALFAIRPQNRIIQSNDCPPITILQAMAIQADDVVALGEAMADYNICTQGTSGDMSVEWKVRNAARVILSLADRNLNTVFVTMNGVIQKLSLMSGQRTIVFVSSGFLVTPDRRPDENVVFERAVRANIVINSLDARGLYALPSGVDASAHTINSMNVPLPAPGAPLSAESGGAPASGQGPPTVTYKAQLARDEALANRDVIAEVADNTGGRFFENRNDMEAGFDRLATAPEYIYVLGFAPQNLKLDGRYHTLKVSLPKTKGLALDARRGYYAPRYAHDPVERSKEEIEEAFFSRDETSELPAVIETQFFKTSEYEAALSVAAKIDVRQLPFRKEADRNRDDLTVVAGLFDSDGNYLMGTEKVVEMRLRDETLKGRVASGITVRSTFKVAPGTYFVRLVVRDSEGQTVAAHGTAVEIK